MTKQDLITGWFFIKTYNNPELYKAITEKFNALGLLGAKTSKYPESFYVRLVNGRIYSGDKSTIVEYCSGHTELSINQLFEIQNKTRFEGLDGKWIEIDDDNNIVNKSW